MAQLPPIPLEAINAGFDWVILSGRRPVPPYKDGKRQSEIPERYSYTVNLPGNCYTALSVSIPGSVDALAAVTDQQIAEGCATLRPLLVRFTDCTVKVYTIQGQQRMSATAAGVELVKTSSK